MIEVSRDYTQSKFSFKDESGEYDVFRFETKSGSIQYDIKKVGLVPHRASYPKSREIEKYIEQAVVQHK